MDYRSTFCERCGLDSDRLESAGASDFRVCPDCSSSTCANCWNQATGRCLACSPFRLAGAAPAAAVVRVAPAAQAVPPVTKSRALRPSRPKPKSTTVAAAAAAPPPAAMGVVASVSPNPTRAVRSDDDTDRRMGRAARIGLVAAVIIAIVIGVRAVTLTGGTVAAHGPAPTDTFVPEFPGQAAPALTDPTASASTTSGGQPGQPGDHPAGGGQPGGGGTSSGGGSGGGGAGPGSGGGGGTPGGTPKPTAGSTPTPAPGTPTPDPGTPTPDPGTPTPDPGTPTPDPGTPTPDPDPS